MSRKWIVVVAVVLCLPAVWWLAHRMGSRIVPVTPPTEGISQTLAAERAANVSSVRYALSLNIPAKRNERVRGSVTLRLVLADQLPLIFDFAQPAEQVSSLRANGQPVDIRSEHGHLVVPAESLARGENIIEIAFIAGDPPLNRNEDFLYSLFVPARASQAFPCFDQPDIKGSLSLSLEMPADWTAVSNGPEIARETKGDRVTVRFGDTVALPTYLFGFAAGKFSVERGERAGRAFHMYHRETDAAKVAANREAIFDLHQQAVEWLETYTDRKYPFQKLDFVLLPAFQFGGMEHAGAIFYNAPYLLLDATATQNDQLRRANLIAHETSHMWFGDLVTMKWFDDVWLKEVFANFMAAKIVNPSFPDMNHELRFFLQHHPPAYDVDRTAGTNQIRQPLENLKDAGSLYGPIIYLKAPIVLRQLEDILGPEELRDGLREYLSRFAFRNATWTELVAILDARTDEDLAAWSRAWVDEPGRPTIVTNLETANGTVSGLTITQSDSLGRSLRWTQQLQVVLGYEHGARMTTVKMDKPTVELPRVKELPLPNYVLANGEGTGYGLFVLDDRSRKFFLARLAEIGDGLTRGIAWVTLWDDMLEGGAEPRQMLDLALRTLPAEREELNVERMLAHTHDLFWRYVSDAERTSVAGRVESTLRDGLAAAATPSLKSAYFSAFRRVVTTPEGTAYLERVWRGEPIAGLTFAETDFIEMAQELALRGVPNADAIIAEQLRRITNPDRTARFAFVTPALSSDPQKREAFFASLARVENRAHERWVTDGLRYLNHPLRRAHAERFIEPSLGMLDVIQRTGDIFFPLDWTSAVLGGHNSASAAQTVTALLAAHNDYSPRMRRVIEQHADPLIRAAKLRAR
ncbi:MAG TPA: M1 family aminopeptidase [Vicinamibacterales bacterium]|nr:M1 family aminopeptidase [Vicinamibacterales bacterium]